jgi:hypothetical protein
MKGLQKISLLVMAVLAIGFSSCGIKDKLDINIPFSVSFDGSINLQLPNSGLDAAFNISDSVSIAAAEDLADYLDRLKSLAVEDVELHITNFSGNSNSEIEGSLELNGSFGGTDAPFGPSNLQAVSDSGLPIILEFDASEQESMSDALLALEKLELVFSGVASGPPVSFDYELVFNFKAVANPLD